MPTRNQRNAEESLEEFLEDYPALGMLGTPHQILPDTPYVVDDEVQLVCKYLKAYSSGGSKGIDRLYKEGTDSLLVSVLSHTDNYKWWMLFMICIFFIISFCKNICKVKFFFFFFFF